MFRRFTGMRQQDFAVHRFLEHECREDRKRHAGEVQCEQGGHPSDPSQAWTVRSRNDNTGGRLRRMS